MRAGALKPGRRGKVRIYYTEFGYQTNPPDPFAGVSLSQQSRWLQEAAYVAWSTPRVEGLNQFRVTDGRIRGNGPLAYREFQSGLYFANGKAKPAARTFRAPIVLRSSGRSRLLVWGQVRRGGRHRVVVERRLAGSKRFRQVAVAETNAEGYFTTRVARRGGAYRFRWSEPSGSGASQALSVKG